MNSQEGSKKFETVSSIPLKKVYTPEDIADLDYEKDLGAPGVPPYVRGAFPNMYRERLWRIDQLKGFGTVEEGKELARFSKAQGDKRPYAVEGEVATYGMVEIDDPEILLRREDIGLTGTPFIGGLSTYRERHADYDLREFCPSGSPYGIAAGIVLAEERGIPIHELPMIGGAAVSLTWIGSPYYGVIPPRPGFKLLDWDPLEWVIRNCPRGLAQQNAGHNWRASGLNAYQEVAMVLAQTICRIDAMLARGLKIDTVAPYNAAINLTSWREFFEEICKIRAFRRMWYKLLTERYGAKNLRSIAVRIHARTSSEDLTYQQPLNNVVRNALRSMAAALAGVQAQALAGHDEAICAPGRESLLLAIRTQQIVQYESGVTNVIDPLGGSYYVEWLTNEIEKKAWEYLQKIEEHGGLLGIVESGWAHLEGMKGAMEWEKKMSSGELKSVGRNIFVMEEEPHTVNVYQVNPKVLQEALDRLERLRKERDSGRVKECLAELKRVCRIDRDICKDIMPAMIEAVKADVTTGEVGNVLRELYSAWKPPLPM